MELRHVFLLIAIIAIGTVVVPSIYSIFAGEHSFYDTGNCLKCHSDIRIELDSSMYHSNLTCENCHVDPNLNNLGPHGNIVTPKCANCHIDVIQSLNNDSHSYFISGANSSLLKKGENEACISCHSSISDRIIFTRPSYFEWDVVNKSGLWTIENLAVGANKAIQIEKNGNNGNIHDISLDNGCLNCHSDIKDAVMSGGHSNEQWTGKHNYVGYADMNLYCRSCHKPYTSNTIGHTPYPAHPFNLNVHNVMTVSCIDCHTKTDLLVNINGYMSIPPYNSTVMGNIETSIAGQPYNAQSYLCMACKNTGNPSPINGSLHFKMLTEPDVAVSVTVP